MNGVELIAAERNRQIEAEGWTPEHDDEHTRGEMVDAAACYCFPGLKDQFWPSGWDASWFKPGPASASGTIRNLVKAGALIAAEIDRIQRGESP